MPNLSPNTTGATPVCGRAAAIIEWSTRAGKFGTQLNSSFVPTLGVFTTSNLPQLWQARHAPHSLPTVRPLPSTVDRFFCSAPAAFRVALICVAPAAALAQTAKSRRAGNSRSLSACRSAASLAPSVFVDPCLQFRALPFFQAELHSTTR